MSTGDLSVADGALSTAAGVYCVTTNYSENNGIDFIAFKISVQNTTSEIHDYIGDLENTETLYTGYQLTNIKFTDEYGTDVTPATFTCTTVDGSSLSTSAPINVGANYANLGGGTVIEVVVSPVDLSIASVAMLDTAPYSSALRLQLPGRCEGQLRKHRIRLCCYRK